MIVTYKRNSERFAPWLKVLRLVQGPLFWAALAVIGGLFVVVVLPSWQGWEPGLIGEIFIALGFIAFWAALMTAFAGWPLRTDR